VGVALSDHSRDYREALDYLFARTTGKSKLGLERTAALLREMGDPQERLRSLHIAGTNGKGSVCATLDTLLRAKGLRVGKYTSPHLVDFRERFLVNGRPVDEQFVVDFIQRWTPTVERIGATFFEATTAMAFDLFARDLIERRSEILRVIQPDRCHARDDRVEHVGRIESAAQPRLDHRHVGPGAGEVVERHRGRRLEEAGADLFDERRVARDE